MAPKRRCPVCRSKKWHKEPHSGLITCSEGHVLQGYINETNETTEFGPHARRKRTLKSTRVKKEKLGSADPNLYHGERARYLYFQSLQILLRMQIRTLIQLWSLPPEFEIICRDTWALHLSSLPSPPPAEPLLHARGKMADDTPNPGSEDDSLSEKKPSKVDDDLSSSESEDETGDEDVTKLLHENSESDSEDELADPQTQQRAAVKKVQKRRGDDAPVGTLAVLVFACWTLRIPVIYKDIINLVAKYTLPYLDPVRLLPPDLTRHLTKHTKKSLSPHFAPTSLLLHTTTARLGRRLYQFYGIFTPELNAAPVLWRAVKHMGGNPTLYILSKTLARYLELPLALHPALAPSVSKFDSRGHKGDNVPPELGLIATAVIALKLVYGFDGRDVLPRNASDPACAMPTREAYLSLLKRMNVLDKKMRQSEFSVSTDEPTIQEMDKELIEKYLDFCERALLTPRREGGDVVTENNPTFERFPLQDGVREGGTELASRDEGDEFGQTKEALAAIPLTEEEEGNSGNWKRAGEGYFIYRAHDILGTVDDELGLVVRRASLWAGVSEDDLLEMVERFERRLVRLWTRHRGADAAQAQCEMSFQATSK